MAVLLVLLKFLTRLFQPIQRHRCCFMPPGNLEALNFRLLPEGGKIPAQKENLQRFCDEGEKSNLYKSGRSNLIFF